MRKWLVFILIVLFVVTITGTTFAAAGSFSDVPAQHWAYDAITKLAKDGLIEGNSDGTFRGDRAMSRYEVAIVVSRAVARYDKADAADRQLIDKLSAEFASELNQLGLRLAKVEAKTNTWVGGDTRMRILGDSPKALGTTKLKGSDMYDFRQRIKFWGTINENVSWQGRLSSNWGNKWGNTDSSYGSTAYFDIMNITAKNALGLDSIRAGRSALDMVGYGLIGKPLAVDGVLIKKQFDNTAFSAYTGNIKSDSSLGTGVLDSGKSYQFTSAQLNYKIDKDLSLGAGYYWAHIPGVSTATGTGTLNTNVGKFDSSTGYDVFVKYQFSGMTLLGDYIGSNLKNAVGLPSSPKGWVVQLSNGDGPGATACYYSCVPLVDVKKQGDNAWAVSYRSIDAGALPSGGGGFDTTAVAYAPQPYNVFTHASDNVNVLYVSYENVLMPNVLLSLEWQDFKIKNQGLTNLTSKNLDKCWMVKFEFFY
ncbi:hypothetical protein Ga0466249_002087 [Sporomusaceae bacterium BoRhaA]|uniref:S-layer homology domain-containing protein n=1 Tax=Pelorhabdus rhamnosifermentans TaxID=2772457 RepID=UPI001C063252|nr:S-layer homology domain-containing protein [Pelorhabdus rhamnosifermentans]MBU2700976.1 hypothetical protein [Pelorhabdus rhamnosifermentans]